MYLSLLGQGCFPQWPSVYAAAERTIRQVSQADPELAQHLSAVAQVEPQVNYKVWRQSFLTCHVLNRLTR